MEAADKEMLGKGAIGDEPHPPAWEHRSSPQPTPAPPENPVVSTVSNGTPDEPEHIDLQSTRFVLGLGSVEVHDQNGIVFQAKGLFFGRARTGGLERHPQKQMQNASGALAERYFTRTFTAIRELGKHFVLSQVCDRLKNLFS